MNSGTDVRLGGSVAVSGNAYLYESSSMAVSGNAMFNGTVYKDSAATFSGTGVTVVMMSSADLSLRGSILELSRAADALMPTQALDAANPMAVDLSHGATYMADPNAKVNVISARHLSLGSNDSIQLMGASSSIFVIKVSGMANFGSGIVLQGVVPKNVLIHVTSAHSIDSVNIGGTSGISGTFLALDRPLNFTGQGSFHGALISGASGSRSINIGGNSGGSITEFVGMAFCTTTTTK